jgi:inosine/xanthosine triphosphatase
MKIAVGSKNPVKIQAVKEVLNEIWDDIEIVSVNANSGIGEMPINEKESIQGAINRARDAMQKTGADFGVGLEGSVNDTDYGMFLLGHVVVLDKYENIGIGNGGGMVLPEKIAKEIKAGKELGPVIDDFSGIKNSKQKDGAVGFFTNGLITRKDGFKMGVSFAMSRFINKKAYD